MLSRTGILAGAVAMVLGFGVISASAAITSVSETASNPASLDPRGAQVGDQPFGDDVFIFTDRGHVFKPAAFAADTGLLSTTGVPGVLPAYLVGQQHIEIANDNRDKAGYALTITVDVPSYVYVLIDNRLDGTLLNTSSPNTTDPVLAGPISWLTSWGRMSTGISPNGQPDYVGVDEGSSYNTVGQERLRPSQTNQAGLNQFYSVYRTEVWDGAIVVGPQAIGGSNMFAVVVAPIPEPGSVLLLGLGSLGLLVRRRQA